MATTPRVGIPKGKTGSPAGTVTAPRTASVSPGTQSTGRATQRAVAAMTPKFGRNLSENVATYRAGAPSELTSQRQFYREQLAEKEQAYYGMEPFAEREFGMKRPEFNTKSVSRAMPMLLVMTSLGGPRTKVNALAMMKALDAGIKGAQEGNEKAYKQALFDYQQNYKEFKDREDVRRRQYDLQRQAAKDGLEMALKRSENADKAVDDYNTDAAKNIQLQLTLDQNRRQFEKHAKDMQLLTAQIETEKLKPQQKKKSLLTAEQINKTMLATRLLNDVNEAMSVMDKRPQDFSTLINAAFTWSPKATELAGAVGGPFSKQSAAVRAAIPSQQAWRRALNTQVVQNAGLSQTVAEMNSQLAAFGSQTLEARKAGMSRVRLSLLRDLEDKADMSDDLREALETKLGMPLSQAVKNAEQEVNRIETEVRAEVRIGKRDLVPPAAKAAGYTQADWDAADEEEKSAWR